jgi:hydrogenase-4 component F
VIDQFNPLIGLLGAPLVGGLAMAALYRWPMTRWLNAVVSGVALAFALTLLVHRPPDTPLLFIDDFNIYLIVLTAFIGFTSALFSAAYVGIGWHNRPFLRFYHPMYQAFQFSMLLALTANNIGLLWVAVEAATLSTVLLVSLYRTRGSVEAAWKYFILCSVGIGLALFGTILVYLAAQPVMGEGAAAMAWTLMIGRAATFQPNLISLAFVFLLVGYGTKVGLVPLHAWLPDAHAEGPTPISAVLSGLLLNVALYALLRFKMLISANGHALPAGPLMIVMGGASVIVAAFMLFRRRDIKRLFAYSSIEHMGIMTFAFGMGGPLANFAGLLHMSMHSLVKSAIFFAVGLINQRTGTRQIADIRGLTTLSPLLGWAFVAAVLAISGLPPTGVFMSEFLVISSTFARQPLLAIPVMVGLAVAFAAMLGRLQGMAFGVPSERHVDPSNMDPSWRIAGLGPLMAHLALALLAGIYLPGPVVAWFQTVARLLG